MIYLKLIASKAVQAITRQEAKDLASGVDVFCDWDYTSFEQVENFVKELNSQQSVKYVAVDRGDFVSPRFSVVKMFFVGQEVSKGFNGDYYPQGTVTKISKTGRKITLSNEKPSIVTKIQQCGSAIVSLCVMESLTSEILVFEGATIQTARNSCFINTF